MYAKSHRPQPWLTGDLYLRVLYVYRHGCVRPGVSIWAFAHLSLSVRSISLAALCIHANVHTWPLHVCVKTREAMTEPLTCPTLLQWWVRSIILKPPLFTPSLSPILDEWLHLPTWSNPPPLAAIFCLSPRHQITVPVRSSRQCTCVMLLITAASLLRRGNVKRNYSTVP